MGRLMSILQNTTVNNGHGSNRTYNYQFPTSVSNNFNDNYYFCGFKCKRNHIDKVFFEDDGVIKKMESYTMPLPFPVSLPTKDVSPLSLSMFAPKNSFTIARCDDSNAILLQFIFDTDCSCIIDVYSFGIEKFTDGKLSFVLTPEKGMKYSSTHNEGSNQLFEYKLEDPHLSNSEIDDTIPITVVISSANNDGHDFQQFSTNLSFELRSNCQPISCVQVTTQKLIYAGNCYLIQEMYGADLSPEQEMRQSAHSNLCVPSIDGKNTDHEQCGHLMQDCVVCMTAIRDTLVLPCRHLCLCSSCGEKLLHQSPACPICRSTFRALLQLGNMEKYLSNSYQHIK